VALTVTIVIIMMANDNGGCGSDYGGVVICNGG
jgi:hypothetical protein